MNVSSLHLFQLGLEYDTTNKRVFLNPYLHSKYFLFEIGM